MSKINTQTVKSQFEQVKKFAKDGLAPILDKNLQDLVRGIRAHRENEAAFISDCINEIKVELQNECTSIKANAVNKLIYLQMLGYDMSWAAFNVIELMSSTRFTFKRIGYLAATKSFHSGTDLLVLSTNTIRKDLHSSNALECCLALNSLACFMNENLAKELWRDIIVLLSANKPFVRKRATLLLYKLFLTYPHPLKEAIPKVVDRLSDNDPSVQASAVSVICELARSSPRSFLPLAQTLFDLMNTSTNNWLLIKLIKLVAYLTPLDSNLSKKLIEPLTSLIHSTSAMSLLYECINTVVAILVVVSMDMPSIQSSAIQLCAQKLSALIEDSDQNLRYLGLLALSRVMSSQTLSQRSRYRELVLRCLDDNDDSIRLRALDLLLPLTTRRSLLDIVRKLNALIETCESIAMRDELVKTILTLCSANNYECISDFEWYITVLMNLAHFPTEHSGQIAEQVIDIAVRVPSVRSACVASCSLFIEENKQNFGNLLLDNGTLSSTQLFCSAIYVCGEFASPTEKCEELINVLLHCISSSFPPSVLSVYIHNVFKLCVKSRKFPDQVVRAFTNLTNNSDAEVQERSCQYLAIIELARVHGDSLFDELLTIFSEDLNPVSAIAQQCVAVPDGLDLDAWIDKPFEDEQFGDVKFDEFKIKFVNDATETFDESANEEESEQQHSETDDYVDTSYQQMNYDSNPYYIKASKKPAPVSKESVESTVTKESHSKMIDEENKRLYRKMRVERPLVLVGEEMPAGAKNYPKTNSNENTELFDEILVAVQASAEKSKEKRQHKRKQKKLSHAEVGRKSEAQSVGEGNEKKESRKLREEPSLIVDDSKSERQENTRIESELVVKEESSHEQTTNKVELKKKEKPKKRRSSTRHLRKVKETGAHSEVSKPDVPVNEDKTTPINIFAGIEQMEMSRNVSEEKLQSSENVVLSFSDTVDDLIMLNTEYNFAVETFFHGIDQAENEVFVKGRFHPQLNQLLELHLSFSIAKHTISDLNINIVNPLSLSTIYTNCMDPSASFVRFRVNAISFPQKLKCFLKYTVDESVKSTTEFFITLPVSRFLVKGKVKESERISGKRSFEIFTTSYDLLFDKLITDFPFTSAASQPSPSLEARTVLNQPVRLMLDNKGPMKTVLTLNGDDEDFVFNLSEEIRTYFR